MMDVQPDQTATVPTAGPDRPLIPMPQRRDVTADSVLSLNGRELGRIADFWEWGFTDLRDNMFRGIFVEWLVGKLLGLSMDRRVSWDCYDLKAGEKTIEVNCSSYLQTWAQRRLTNPIYGRLYSQCWDPTTDTFGPARYNADFYIFCLQTCKDAAVWDALDLGQWRFWALQQKQLVDSKSRTSRRPGWCAWPHWPSTSLNRCVRRTWRPGFGRCSAWPNSAALGLLEGWGSKLGCR